MAGLHSHKVSGASVPGVLSVYHHIKLAGYNLRGTEAPFTLSLCKLDPFVAKIPLEILSMNYGFCANMADMYVRLKTSTALDTCSEFLRKICIF